MTKKIILGAAVFVFAVFALCYSYSGYGKKVSENTSATPDGKIFVCRKFTEISKVIAIDSKKKSHRKEVRGYNYNTANGELVVTEDLSDFTTPIFHIEGQPSEPVEFILWNMDSSRGPIAVFLNGKTCAQNREYVVNESEKTLTLKTSPKELSSLAIVWHTTEGGLASISEMTQKEADLYAELEGVWFTENAKKNIASLTEYPILDFSDVIDGTPAAAYAHGAKPKIVMKKYTQKELQKQLDEFPVNAYKIRRNVNMKNLSSEAGFKINLPQKCGEYKIVSTMLIESSLKGELTKMVDFSYDKTDFFSLDSINVEARAAPTVAENEADKIEYPISTKILELKVPVKKQMCWSISNTGEGVLQNGASQYKPEVLCIYSWGQNETLYKIQCLENKLEEVEAFLENLF